MVPCPNCPYCLLTFENSVASGGCDLVILEIWKTWIECLKLLQAMNMSRRVSSSHENCLDDITGIVYGESTLMSHKNLRSKGLDWVKLRKKD